MGTNLSLDLAKVELDTRTIANATALANAEGQLVPEERRQEILEALWSAENLLVAIQDLHSRSEERWRTEDRERRLAELDARYNRAG